MSIVLIDEPNVSSSTSFSRNLTVLEPIVGSRGAFAFRDGMDARSISGLSRANPIEVIESDTSIIVESWRIEPDTGGAGKFRGGNALSLEFSVRTPGTIVTARGQGKYRFRQWGLRGGYPGSLGKILLNPGKKGERDSLGLRSFHCAEEIL